MLHRNNSAAHIGPPRSRMASEEGGMTDRMRSRIRALEQRLACPPPPPSAQPFSDYNNKKSETKRKNEDSNANSGEQDAKPRKISKARKRRNFQEQAYMPLSDDNVHDCLLLSQKIPKPITPIDSSSEEGNMNPEVQEEPMDSEVVVQEEDDGELGSDMIGRVLSDVFMRGDARKKYRSGAQDASLPDKSKFVYLDTVSTVNDDKMKLKRRKDRLRALGKASKRSQKHASLSQHRKLGSFELSKKYWDYKLFVPMHEMWKGYMQGVVKGCKEAGLESALQNADYHGALFAVVQCKSTSFQGVRGIMVRETLNTFGILTEGNRFRVVPKKESVFGFQLGSMRVSIQGEKMCVRNRHVGLFNADKATTDV